MSGTTQEQINGTGKRRGRPFKVGGTKRVRRNKAQIAAAARAADSGTVLSTGLVSALSPDQRRPDQAGAARAMTATELAASIVAQLIGSEVWVRNRAAEIVAAVCAGILKAA